MASYLVAYLSTFIDKMPSIKPTNFQKANSAHLQLACDQTLTKLAPNIVCEQGSETMKFVYVALISSISC